MSAKLSHKMTEALVLIRDKKEITVTTWGGAVWSMSPVRINIATLNALVKRNLVKKRYKGSEIIYTAI